MFLPLSGIRVLDVTSIIYGPYTTQILGDLGADVIKIEPPEGDATRQIGPSRNPGMGAVFLGANRNKRSLVLDLKKPAAVAAMWRLIDGADALVHNMRPQKMAALGFDPDTVMARNPRIVYGGLHGYREDGPYGRRPAYDDVIQGESGFAGTFTMRDGAPMLAPTVVADKSAALLAATGLVAAMVQRLRTGKGVYVEIAMFESMVGYTLLEHQYGATFRPPEGPAGYARALSKQRKPHATRDGYICMLPYTDRQWLRFWEMIGTPERAREPRFESIAKRALNIDALYGLAGAALVERTTAEWLEALRAAEIPCGPVNTFEDLKTDPQLSALGFFRPFEHPSEGPIEVPDTAFQFDRQSLPVRHHQPRLGEQSREILREAGLSDSEIDAVL